MEKKVEKKQAAATPESISAEIKEAQERGEALRAYLNSEEAKKEPLALKRLKMEQFNIYCSLIECLSAQESILK